MEARQSKTEEELVFEAYLEKHRDELERFLEDRGLYGPRPKGVIPGHNYDEAYDKALADFAIFANARKRKNTLFETFHTLLERKAKSIAHEAGFSSTLHEREE